MRYESWSFQLLKSGMKYSRISRAESFPVSLSKHSQSRSASNPINRTGNSTRLPSFYLRLRALAISVFTHSLLHAVLGEDQQQLVMQPNGLIYLLMNLAPAMNVVRREPATNAFILQISVEPVGKLLVFASNS